MPLSDDLLVDHMTTPSQAPSPLLPREKYLDIMHSTELNFKGNVFLIDIGSNVREIAESKSNELIKTGMKMGNQVINVEQPFARFRFVICLSLVCSFILFITLINLTTLKKPYDSF